MKKTIMVLCLFGMICGAVAAQNRPPKTKCNLEHQRLKAVSKSNTDLIEDVPEVEVVPEPVEVKRITDFKNEGDFRKAYDDVLNEYLAEYSRADKALVENNAAVDKAKAACLAEIESKVFSNAYNPTEIEYKKAELRENVERTVEAARNAKLGKLQSEYNSNIAVIDAKKGELDAAIQSATFIIRDVDVCISEYDNVSKSWSVKFTSTNPEIKFSTDWFKIQLDREAFVEQFEKIQPKILEGLYAEVHYSISVSKFNDEPEDMTHYERHVTRIELFDKRGTSVYLFDNLDIPAGSYYWNSYRKLLFVEGSASVATSK